MSDEEPGETVVMCRLMSVFVGRQRDRYKSSWTGSVSMKTLISMKMFIVSMKTLLISIILFFINFHDFLKLISMIFFKISMETLATGLTGRDFIQCKHRYFL